MVQLVTRIDDDMAAAIDGLIGTGEFESRSDVVRQGISALIEYRHRAKVAAAIIDGYERLPETDAELDRARSAAIAMIADEPW
jgi:Arc/MetJ-type ribon-helix-helix transcriptional regulator